MEKVVLWVPTATKRPESWLCVDSYMQMDVPEGIQMVWKRGLPGNIQIVWIFLQAITHGYGVYTMMWW